MKRLLIAAIAALAWASAAEAQICDPDPEIDLRGAWVEALEHCDVSPQTEFVHRLSADGVWITDRTVGGLQIVREHRYCIVDGALVVAPGIGGRAWRRQIVAYAPTFIVLGDTAVYPAGDDRDPDPEARITTLFRCPDPED